MKPVLLTFLFLNLISVQSRAQVVPGLPSLNIPVLISSSVANEVIRDIGAITDERPFEGATPLGVTIGLDATVSLEVIQIPVTFWTALATAGYIGGTYPFMPLPKINLHKGLGAVDIGGSYLGYLSYSAWGAYLKVAVAGIDEGPTCALRLSYAHGSFDYINTTTWTPQILVSRKIDFADPYLGVGYQFVSGSLSGSQTQGNITLTVPNTPGSGGSFIAFTGIIFRPPHVGLKISVEGSYSVIGANSMGAEVGFSF
jgi:hypothetical protein